MHLRQRPTWRGFFGLGAICLAIFGLLPSLAQAQTSPVTPATAPADMIDSGVTAWMLTSTALVLLMVPGLAMFYGGLVRTKNVLGTMMHSFAAMAVVGVLWVVCGYSIAFGHSVCGGWCGWDSSLAWLSSLDDKIFTSPNYPSIHIPEYIYAMFQGKFAIITPALIAGAFAERVRFRGYCIFLALWAVLIYDPLCHWVWATDGFLSQMGALDYAGGTVVHISAGVSGLVAAIYLGARRGYPSTAMHPNNLVMTLTGAGLLWVGWFGFNAGSSVASNLETARALTVTQAAAAAGALAWMIIEAIHHRKSTSLGLCSGILAGLVAITPAAGVVTPAGAMILGVVASFICYFAVMAKNKLGYDDSLDVFSIHGIAGIFGALGLTFLIRKPTIAIFVAKDSTWTVMHQFTVQLTAVGCAIGYCLIGTIILVVLIDKIVGLRLDSKGEMAGMDQSLHGEAGYGLLNLN